MTLKAVDFTKHITKSWKKVGKQVSQFFFHKKWLMLNSRRKKVLNNHNIIRTNQLIIFKQRRNRSITVKNFSALI